MNHSEQFQHREVQQALVDLRNRTAKNLQTFNDTVPHASWLRRSEIERFTVDLLWAVERAPVKRRPTPVRKIQNALSWIKRMRTAAHVR